MTTMSSPFDDPAVQLFASIIEANSRQLASTTNSLIDSYIIGMREAKAELAIIRDRIHDLFTSPYAPSQGAILSALWPSHAAIQEKIETGDPLDYPRTTAEMTGGMTGDV